MPEAVLGPMIVFAISVWAPAKQRRLIGFVLQKECIAFCRNCETPELALFSCGGIAIVIFNLEDRSGRCLAVVRV